MDLVTWFSFTLVSVIALTPPARAAIARAAIALNGMASRRFVAPLAVFATAMLLGSVPVLLGHAPIPSIHDEFGNLLIADTFLHGRLTNPTPAFWEHFETVHQIMRPTYAAKFPPGLGMALAIGKMLGSPAIGAFGSVALACAFVTAALRSWLPPRWALVGGLLATTHTLIYWWGQSFWGGGVAMLGGAVLLAGAGRAMRRKPDVVAGIAIGAGLAILAISRPLECLIVALMFGAAVLWRSLARHRLRLLLLHTTPAMLAILLPAAVWMGYYNSRVTGDWSRMPWVEYARQAMTTPIFISQQPPPEPAFRHEKLRHFHAGAERAEYDAQLALGYFGRLKSISDEALALWLNQKDAQAQPHEWLPRPTMLALPAILFACWRARGARLGVLVFVGLMLIHPAITPWMRAQYMAPAAAAFFLALTVALRLASRWRPLGAALAAGFVAAQLAALVVMIAQIALNPFPPGIARERIVRQLKSEPGRHLVLVVYSPGPQQIFEWVYNDADVESSRIIFARPMSLESERALLGHFKDRNVWVLNVSDRSIQFERYVPATAP